MKEIVKFLQRYQLQFASTGIFGLLIITIILAINPENNINNFHYIIGIGFILYIFSLFRISGDKSEFERLKTELIAKSIFRKYSIEAVRLINQKIISNAERASIPGLTGLEKNDYISNIKKSALRQSEIIDGIEEIFSSFDDENTKSQQIYVNHFLQKIRKNWQQDMIDLPVVVNCDTDLFCSAKPPILTVIIINALMALDEWNHGGKIVLEGDEWNDQFRIDIALYPNNSQNLSDLLQINDFQFHHNVISYYAKKAGYRIELSKSDQSIRFILTI